MISLIILFAILILCCVTYVLFWNKYTCNPKNAEKYNDTERVRGSVRGHLGLVEGSKTLNIRKNRISLRHSKF